MRLAFNVLSQRGLAGTAVFTEEVLRAYVGQLPVGQEVLVFGVRADILRLQSVLPPQGIRFVAVGMWGSSVWRVVAEQLVLPLLLWWYRVDCVYSPSPFFSWGTNKPCLVTVHDAAYGLFGEYRGVLSAWYIRLSLWFIRWRHVPVVTVSHSAATDVVRVYGFLPQQVSVVTEAAPTVTVADSVAWPALTAISSVLQPQRYLLYIGSGLGRKNLARLLAAWATIAPHWPEHSLVIAGAVVPTPTPHVLFLGVISPAAKERLYADAVALVYPSLYEGFGLPVLEAQKRLVPVLAGDIPALRETAGHSVCYVDPYNVSEIAAGLERLLSDSLYRTDLVERGTVNVQRFSWDSTARQLHTIITNVYAHSTAQ